MVQFCLIHTNVTTRRSQRVIQRAVLISSFCKLVCLKSSIESLILSYCTSFTPNKISSTSQLVPGHIVQAHRVVVDGGWIGVTRVKLGPGVREGHGDLPATAEGVHVAVAQQLLGGLEVARVQVTHEDLDKEEREDLGKHG